MLYYFMNRKKDKRTEMEKKEKLLKKKKQKKPHKWATLLLSIFYENKILKTTMEGQDQNTMAG